ncbi:MAG: hypothetical protein ACKOAD_00625 [Gammaproteobacteria bacterium]
MYALDKNKQKHIFYLSLIPGEKIYDLRGFSFWNNNIESIGFNDSSGTNIIGNPPITWSDEILLMLSPLPLDLQLINGHTENYPFGYKLNDLLLAGFIFVVIVLYDTKLKRFSIIIALLLPALIIDIKSIFSSFYFKNMLETFSISVIPIQTNIHSFAKTVSQIIAGDTWNIENNIEDPIETYEYGVILYHLAQFKYLPNNPNSYYSKELNYTNYSLKKSFQKPSETPRFSITRNPKKRKPIMNFNTIYLVEN